MMTFHEEFMKIKGELLNSNIANNIFRNLQLKPSGRPLILYGAGDLGYEVLYFSRNRNIHVSCFCDKRVTGRYEELEIITPEVLCNEYKNAIVIICSIVDSNVIFTMLSQLGFPEDQLISFPPVTNSFCPLKEFDSYVGGYEWAYNFFKDDRSKQIILDRIRLMLYDRTPMPNTKCDTYYEDGFIELKDNEIFVDGGAYTGDTAETFLLKSKNIKNSHAYSFEPEKESFDILYNKFGNNAKITAVQKGLWSSETELDFHHLEDGGSSFVYGFGVPRGSFPLTSLDTYFKNIPESKWPTFIKMDIEGSESEALKGSSLIIKKCKPKLAICAYHKKEHIYELPKIILNIRDDYRFALRHYEYSSLDTVLYAV